MKLVSKARSGQIRLRRWFEDKNLYRRLRRINQQISAYERENPPADRPVIFFNASTRINRLSQNAAFSLLTSWGLRLSGISVRYFVCQAGMAQCQLGAKLRGTAEKPPELPPCDACQRVSQRLYPVELTRGFGWQEIDFGNNIEKMSLAELIQIEWEGYPLGALCLPSLRWSLRQYNLRNDLPTRALMRKFLLSAANIVNQFKRLIIEERPQAVVLFNGISYPEAVVREVTLRKGVRVITHEVSPKPLSAFFSHDHATAYKINIPDDFALSADENAKLGTYLSKRFQGDFTMAGIRFWPEIQSLDTELLDKMAGFRQVVSVFTNVIFDTSQTHANVLFNDMFEWLDAVLDIARRYTDTLFIIRAHPDEARPGKESRETVESRLMEQGAMDLANIVFISSQDYLNSYELIQHSKFVMVYNSSIGLESTLLGTVVLAGGRSRYSDYLTVYLPSTHRSFVETSDRFLKAKNLSVPKDFDIRARKFMFYHLNYASIDFSRFIKQDPTSLGNALLRDFDAFDLLPNHCVEMNILRAGILNGMPFT